MGRAKVHLLPEDIINKIAAGEVIERPASVIKELMENSLDANAKSIQLTILDGGKSLIQIDDNGHGIHPKDLEVIFQRHATSKISSLDDLFAIQSLGFRGEALYSIAAISDIQIDTRVEEEDSGWLIHMNGAKRQTLKPSAKPKTGTSIRVEDLFFNTPARRKFLKTHTTEFHHILSTVIPYFLLHSDKSFKVIHQDKEIFDLPADTNPAQRFAKTLRLNPDHILTARQEDNEHLDIKIQLILGDMNIKRSRRDMQFLFVNDRPVFNRNIMYHINQIYRLMMPHDLFPAFAIFIMLPAHETDVNIHPTKREVKIRNEQHIIQMLRRLCETTLLQKTAIPQTKHPTDLDEQTPTPHVSAALKTHIDPVSNNPEPMSNFSTTNPMPQPDGRIRDYAYPREEKQKSRSQSTYTSSTQQHHLFTSPIAEPDDPERRITQQLKNARYIGHFINKYQIFEWEKSLLVIDQHAAQERITYERLIQQMETKQMESQRLLTPMEITLSRQEMLIWEENKTQLNELGFETTAWDEQTIAIHSHPNLIKDIEQAIRHLLAGEHIQHCDHDTIARRACKASVRAGDKLNAAEASHQRDTLLTCFDPFTCPHGRPTVIEMTSSFIDKQFLRT